MAGLERLGRARFGQLGCFGHDGLAIQLFVGEQGVTGCTRGTVGAGKISGHELAEHGRLVILSADEMDVGHRRLGIRDLRDGRGGYRVCAGFDGPQRELIETLRLGLCVVRLL